MTTKRHLQIMGACHDAIDWADGKEAWDQIINECQRPDWLLWLDDKHNILDDKERRLLACYFVRNTPLADGRKLWDLLTDERSRNAVRVSERYARGSATDQELIAARAAAWAAAGDAAGDAAGAAAWDAAGDAAGAAAGAAARAAAWAAAGAAAGAAARAAARAFQARYIVKKYGKRIIAALNTKYPL
jgi:hypothetical protein